MTNEVMLDRQNSKATNSPSKNSNHCTPPHWIHPWKEIILYNRSDHLRYNITRNFLSHNQTVPSFTSFFVRKTWNRLDFFNTARQNCFMPAWKRTCSLTNIILGARSCHTKQCNVILLLSKVKLANACFHSTLLNVFPVNRRFLAY